MGDSQTRVSAADAGVDLDTRTRSRVGSERWSSTTARRRRRRRRCCTTTSTSCTGCRRSSVRYRARRSLPSVAGSCRSGVEDNSFLLFSELMDSASLFLTANCDTVYFWGFVDLSDGPMVLDVPSLGAPSGILGTIDDMWFRWVTDVGLPGPDRGRGRPVPDRGTGLRRAAARQRVPRLPRPHDTGDRDRPGVHGRQRPEDPGRSDPQRRSRVSATCPVRTAPRSRASWPGDAPLGAAPAAAGDPFRRGVGQGVQHHLPERLRVLGAGRRAGAAGTTGAGDPELLGLLAAVGIVHGKPFEPDARMRKILEDAVVVGNATARTVTFAARPEEGFAFYPDSAVVERALRRRLRVPRPAPADHRRRPGRRPERRCPQARLPHQLLLHGHRHHTGDVHAPHRHRLAVHLRDARQRRRVLRRRPQLSPHAPARHPREPLLVGDPRTTARPAPCSRPISTCPASGSQSGTVETNPDGSTDIYFGPTAPTARRTTGSRPFPGRAGGRSSGSTTRSSRSSTRPGGPARSNRSDRTA